MVKHFCDICGVEIKKGSRWSQVEYRIITDSGTGVTLKEPEKTLDVCNDCITKGFIGLQDQRVYKEIEGERK